MGPFSTFSDDGVDSGQDSFDGPYLPQQDCRTVEIALDADLLNTLYRRSRRRLRDIQSACQALLKLDRARSTLRISGSQESIQAVQRQLENLSGPCKSLAAAVWAELMRTRTLRYSSQAIIAHMQNKSGCRIHIERSRQEVRLFGPKEGIGMADKLLDEFAETCCEEAVSVANPTTALSSPTLQALAHAFGVTFRVEDRQIVVLGVISSVSAACAELRRYVADPANYSVENLPKASESEAEEAAAEEMRGRASEPCVGGAAPPGPLRMGVVTQPKPATNKQVSQQCGQGSACQQQGFARSCPTCGSGRFCSSCGVLVWQVPFISFPGQSDQGMMQAMVPAGGMMVASTGYEVGTPMGMNGGMGYSPSAPMDDHQQEPDQQQQQQMQAGGIQHWQPQVMYFDPKSCDKMQPAAGQFVPIRQFQAMPNSPSGSSQTQPGQMGTPPMMQAYMVPTGMIPAWCGL